MEISIKWRSIPRYFLYSLGIHGAVVLITILWSYRIPLPVLRPSVVNLELIEIPPVEKKPRLNKAEKDKKTIVDQDKVNEELDPTAQYLSSHNQKVLKETVATQHGQFQNKKQPAPPVKTAAESSSKPAKAKTASPSVSMPKDFFGSYKDTLAKSLEKQEREAQEMAQKGVETSQTRDYLPGKEAGLETLLSTREFVYYSYYTRIRNQLSEYWEPKIKQKVLNLFKKGRRIASNEDHVTKVQIVLDAQGLLMKVQVLGASGVQDLDDVAVEAFKAAAPFPNPPKGIVEADGTVKIQWDFVVES